MHGFGNIFELGVFVLIHEVLNKGIKSILYYRILILFLFPLGREIFDFQTFNAHHTHEEVCRIGKRWAYLADGVEILNSSIGVIKINCLPT